MNGVVSIGFTAYLEVGWAVLCVAAVLLDSRHENRPTKNVSPPD